LAFVSAFATIIFYSVKSGKHLYGFQVIRQIKVCFFKAFHHLRNIGNELSFHLSNKSLLHRSDQKVLLKSLQGGFHHLVSLKCLAIQDLKQVLNFWELFPSL